MSSIGDERPVSVSPETTTAASSPVDQHFKCPYASSRRESGDTVRSTLSSYSIEDSSDPHCYRRPTKTDVRGPCPALNTLANHGYIPRDGRNITPKMLLAALQHPDTYHCTGPLARILVYGGFLLLYQNGRFPKSISLLDIARHNRIEHDASVVHRNTPPNEKYAPVDVDQHLLEHFFGELEFMTLERIVHRRAELEVASPIDGLHSEIARGEWSLVVGIFGRANQGKIHRNTLAVWLEENRFVEGWKPSRPQTLVTTVKTSFNIRKKMKKARVQYLKSGNETRQDSYIKEALNAEESEKS